MASSWSILCPSRESGPQVGFAVIMTGIACWSHMKIKEQQDLGLNQVVGGYLFIFDVRIYMKVQYNHGIIQAITIGGS